MSKILKTIILTFLLSKNLFAQDKASFGIAILNNFPLNTIGLEIRSQLPLTNRIVLAPDIKYAPTFNKIHELYAGIDLHLILVSSTKKVSFTKSSVEPNKPNLYLTTGAEYNHWFNFINSINIKAKKDNILPKIGIGTSFGSLTTRFFVEAKYNIIWNETYGEIGILFYPGFMKLKRKNNCPIIL